MTIQDFMKGDAFALHAGVELLEVECGYARVRMKVEPMHLNAGGVCQGGAIFTLADFAFAVATNSHAQLTLSVNSSIHFLRSVSEGYLYAEANEMSSSHRVIYCEVSVLSEDGELVATLVGTGYRKDVELPFPPVP